uniref:Uncharacterized protein n=1 Tax=Alexandrium andersonii TaxID=327968 RepID=A0A7S2AK02_9DINO|mmetsp:Transcript_13593/g.30807  ORF Transcript_13593/g.30807 Transcript_13593/m.30807 type:complete len:230 (+) Transcript_13593:93-782(+)
MPIIIPGSNGRSFRDLDIVDVVLELRDGNVIHAQGDEAFDFLEADFETALIRDNVAWFQLNAQDGAQHGAATTEVPVSWVNRLVRVKLDVGEVLGVLSDDSLRDGMHMHLIALPGCSALALAFSSICGVLLVQEAVHVHFCRSDDGEVSVWRWLQQESGEIWVRELHADIEVTKASIHLQTSAMEPQAPSGTCSGTVLTRTPRCAAPRLLASVIASERLLRAWMSSWRA